MEILIVRRAIKYLQRMLWILLLASSAWSAPEAVDSMAEYQIKAAFLYKFCLYIEWPPTAFASADSPIVLGIAGPESLVAELENMSRGRALNGRSMQVRHIDNNSNLTALHILFVARAEQSKLPQLVLQAQKLPLLVVTESDGGLNDGGGINFFVQDSQVRFDVGLDSTNRQGLRLSAQLLKVARTVRGEAAH